jgi:hypothetical protein
MIIAVTLERKTTDEVARSELRIRMEIWLETEVYGTFLVT